MTAELWNPATGPGKISQRCKKPDNTTRWLCSCRTVEYWSVAAAFAAPVTTSDIWKKNIEIFSPPYLFKLTEAALSPSARQSLQVRQLFYRQSFGISTENPKAIKQIVLVRPASVTHSVNFEQRRVPLTFSFSRKNQLQATAPVDAAIAPPGYYMMFIIDDKGVPSVAKMVKLG
jgi:hypothetical protein